MPAFDQINAIVVFGAIALAICAGLWALRVSDGHRSAAKKQKDRAQELEERLARSDSVFGAHPGVVLVWEDDGPSADHESGREGGQEGGQEGGWNDPRLYGSPLALSAMLKFAEMSDSNNPSARILDGLADLEARDGSGAETTLRANLRDLRQSGAAFSLTLIGPNGRFIEADGRTAGARAVLWLTDSTVKGLDESNVRGRLEEARQVIARDPAAFLDMLGRAPFPAWRLSSGMKLQWANTAYLNAVEAKSLDQAINRQIHLDPQTVAQAERVIETGAQVDDKRHVVMRGERRALKIAMFPLSGGIGGMAFDLTDEEEARAALDRHVRAHDQTLDHVADAVAIFGPDKKLIFFNKAFSALWEFDAHWLAERPSHGVLLDRLRDERKLPTHSDYAGWRARELAHYQEIAEAADETWVLQGGRSIRVTRQRHPLGGLLIIFKDMTTELTLKASYNALIGVQEATLDKLHEAVAVFGADGRLKLSNNAFREMWNLSLDFVDSGPDFDKVTSACLPLYHHKENWLLIKGRVTNPSPQARQEYKSVMRLSDERVLNFITQPLPNGATLIAFMDVTATRQVEAMLHDRAEAFAAADRLKTEFVKNVSYQLRSPLSVMLGYAQLLDHQLHGELNPKQLGHVQSILTAGENLAKLVENILDLAMIEAGRLELDLSDVQLASVIDDSITMSRTRATDTEVEIEVQLDPNLGAIRADDKRVRQILFNLLTNARRFTEANGKIIVGAERSDGSVRIWVQDSGSGIEPERQASAFDAFDSGDQRGAGLGLALVKSFVELHGGWVKLDSEPGKGSTINCYLPAEPAMLAPDPDLEFLDSTSSGVSS